MSKNSSAMICSRCFGDKFIEESIFPNKFRNTGVVDECSICEKKDTEVVPISEFLDEFEQLISMYTENIGHASVYDRPLHEHIREDWGIFPTLKSSEIKYFLTKLFNDNDIDSKVFTIKNHEKYLPVDQKWDEFKPRIKHENRWFFKNFFDLEVLKDILGQLLITQDETTNWFRCRTHDESTKIPVSEMGAPPKEKASHGRANPVGISYLYVASDPATAISETRPHPGQQATVATIELQTSGSLKLVDLRNPLDAISPFEALDTIQDTNTDDEDYLVRVYSQARLLKIFSEELTLPVVPSRNSFDYIPTQYICEFIKSLNYDGVIYNSSIGEGYNLVFFDTTSGKYEIKNTELYDIENVSIQSRISII